MFQSGLSEWDSSESESAPVVRAGTFPGSAAPHSSAAVKDKPPLASVVEKPEVCCLSFVAHPSFAFVTSVHVLAVERG